MGQAPKGELKRLSRRDALGKLGLFGIGGLAMLAGCGSDTTILSSDGGTTGAGLDAGSGADAGSGLDGGSDAGSGLDAGVDAGSGLDAGSDAGTDAGVDAGLDAGAADAGTDAGTAPATCETINDETSGPYPDKDGMVSKSAYYRRDITEGKSGVPLTVTLRVLDVGSSCGLVEGANVEVWHCDATGIYSEYANSMNAGSTSTTFLRGVQTTDANGEVTFDTIYPGWYSVRVTHIHIQVYKGTQLIKTTQLGFPDSVNATVYGDTALYAKGQNTQTDDDDDNVLGTQDGGHAHQIAEITGSNSAGYVASLDIGIASY